MPDWLTDEKVLAALISATVAAIGGTVSFLIARREIHLKSRAIDTQVELKSKELESQAQLKSRELEAQADLKTRELEAFASRLRAEQEALQQEQLTEILKKRIETYPTLYEIISLYGRNWEIEGKRRDHEWAKSFLKALIDNNAKNGALFSEEVYRWYGKLRTFLEDLTRQLSTGRLATSEEVAQLYSIIRGGLGTSIKNELGSYVTLIVSATYRGREATTDT